MQLEHQTAGQRGDAGLTTFAVDVMAFSTRAFMRGSLTPQGSRLAKTTKSADFWVMRL
jgi:hypothetical protein